MAGRIHGKNGQVKMDTTPASPVTPIVVADLNAWTLDLSQDRVDVTCFGDTNKRRVTGLPDYSGTLAGCWNSATSPILFTVILGVIAVWLRLIPDSTEPTYFFEGLANVDGSLNVDASGAVTISSKWDAAGNWVMRP